MAVGVGVEEMVGAGIVLVDAALDEPHAEDAGVEVEILLRRSRDRGDVVDAVDPVHAPLYRKAAMGSDLDFLASGPSLRGREKIQI